jgi:cellulose synthase/poly-beta-1,6-N-acetylglucosamine synthase-like glycosyltransferase
MRPRTLAAALDNDYPGEVETIFVFDDDLDPAFATVRQAIADHVAAGRRGTAMLMVAGAPPATMTGKLHAMIAGLERATGELVAFGDSDTRPHPYSLRLAVEKLLTTDRAGSVFVPVVAAEASQTAGDVGAALMLNGLYGPAVADTVRRTGDMPFIMGQLMVFRRDTLKSLHDLRSVRGELVDDMRIGMDVVAGWAAQRRLAGHAPCGDSRTRTAGIRPHVPPVADLFTLRLACLVVQAAAVATWCRVLAWDSLWPYDRFAQSANTSLRSPPQPPWSR